MRLVHLKTGHFGEKKMGSYVVLFLINKTPADQIWSSLVCDMLTVVHNFTLRQEGASGSKYFQSSDRLNHIICKPAVVLVFKWTSLICRYWNIGNSRVGNINVLSRVNISISQGKYGRRLYCDHVTKCFVSKCVIQVAMYSYDLISGFSPNFNSNI